MKVLKYGISFTLVASAVVLLLDAVFLAFVTTTILIPAELLNSSTGLDAARILARCCASVGSITFLPGVIGWIIFFKNKDRIGQGQGKTRKDVK